MKKFGPHTNKGAFSAAQVGPGFAPQQHPHHNKNQHSVATSSSNYKNSILSLNNNIVTKGTSSAASASIQQSKVAGANSLKLSQKPTSCKKGSKQHKKQFQQAEQAIYARGSEAGASDVDREVIASAENKTTE